MGIFLWLSPEPTFTAETTTWMCYFADWVYGPKPIWLDFSGDKSSFTIGSPETDDLDKSGSFTIDEEFGLMIWQFNANREEPRTTFP